MFLIARTIIALFTLCPICFAISAAGHALLAFSYWAKVFHVFENKQVPDALCFVAYVVLLTICICNVNQRVRNLDFEKNDADVNDLH